MQLIGKYIRKAPKGISCHDFCIGVSRQINKHYKEADIPRLIEHPEERLTASAVVYSRLNREIWMIGDCQCMVGGTFYDNPKPYEQELAEHRAQIINEGTELREHYLVNDTARQQIIPQMLEANFQPWEIVLASDGYPFLCPTLQESEEKLAWQRENDPLNIGEFKATKAFTAGNNSFDDRSYIRFKV